MRLERDTNGKQGIRTKVGLTAEGVGQSLGNRLC